MEEVRTLKKFYIAVTIIFYLLLILGYTLLFISSDGKNVLLASNELGDFLAGVFAPLAFVFLWLGYRQQGKAIIDTNLKLEQQLNDQKTMLELQKQEAQERKNTVQPIVDFTFSITKGREIIFNKKKNNFEEKEESEECVTIKIIVKNLGHKVNYVKLRCQTKLGTFSTYKTVWEQNKNLVITELLPIGEWLTLKDKYLDFELSITYTTVIGGNCLLQSTIQTSVDLDKPLLTMIQLRPTIQYL